MRVKLGDSRLGSEAELLLLASRPVAGSILRTFVQYSIVFGARPEATSDVISDVVVDQAGTNVHENLVVLGQTVLEIYDPLTL